MKFSSRADVQAPIEFVFDQISDFDALELQGLRRGLKIMRKGKAKDDTNPVGSGWQIHAKYRGKLRQIDSEIVAFDAPNGYVLHGTVGGVGAVMAVDLVALSRQTTRISMVMDLTPTSLSARLLVQSMKFARSGIERKLAKRMADYAAELENRYQK